MRLKPFMIMMVGFAAMSAIVLLVALGMTSGPVKVADDFFADLRDGDFAAAYEHLSREFHGNTAVTDLQAFAQESALARYDNATWWHRSVSGDQGALDGEVETRDGEYVPVTMYFLREDGVWKIYQIDWESEEPIVEPVPGEESTASIDS
jgi:hypothetical protein